MAQLKYITQPDLPELTIGKCVYIKRGRFWLRKSRAHELQGWYDVTSGVNELLDEMLRVEEERRENT